MPGASYIPIETPPPDMIEQIMRQQMEEKQRILEEYLRRLPAPSPEPVVK